MDGNKKFNWIDESIVIDFPVPEPIMELIQKIEEYDRKEMLMEYVCWADVLDAFAKGWIGDGLTEKQYDKLCFKYR